MTGRFRTHGTGRAVLGYWGGRKTQPVFAEPSRFSENPANHALRKPPKRDGTDRRRHVGTAASRSKPQLGGAV